MTTSEVGRVIEAMDRGKVGTYRAPDLSAHTVQEAIREAYREALAERWEAKARKDGGR